jgi:hypothetical protein
MMRMLGVGGLALVAGLLAASSARADPGESLVTLKSDASTILQSRSGRHTARVAISIEQIGKGSNLPGFFDDPNWYAPRTQVQRLVVSIDGRDVRVPLTAVADIYDPHYASVAGARSGFRLDIQAGDAAETYTVSLYFDGQRLTRRHISVAGTIVERDVYMDGPTTR